MSADAHFAPASDARRRDGTPFSRFSAMFMKEFIQLRRDRVTFATMIMIPLLQIVLFGFAINTTPHNLPAAVLLHEQNYMTRSVLGALRNTEYFDFAAVAHSEAEVDSLIRSGKVLFAIEIPAGFERAVATIFDANLTTLIVAVILYAVGTGPVKGFAVTLSLGIVTSMFTAIMGTRALINLIYGGRRVQSLSIGGRAA